MIAYGPVDVGLIVLNCPQNTEFVQILLVYIDTCA